VSSAFWSGLAQRALAQPVSDFDRTLWVGRGPKARAEPDAYFLGLDLGQAVDFTALAGLRRSAIPGAPRQARFRYEAVGIRRWPLRTPYTQIAQEVAVIVSGPLAGCTLGVDKTGVGAGVLEIIKAAKPRATIRPVTITAGAQVTPDGLGFKVPKLDLVAAVTAMLESGRLAIPGTLPEAQTLGKELLAFRAKVTAAGNETLAADWRTRAHDDLCLALAIACWLGERPRKQLWIA
jgi:hypothetical protein